MSDTNGRNPEPGTTGGAKPETRPETSPEAPKINPARPRPPVIEASARRVEEPAASPAKPQPPRPEPTAKPEPSSKPDPAPKPTMAAGAAAAKEPAKAPTEKTPGEGPSDSTPIAPLLLAGLGGAALATVLVIALNTAGLMPSANDGRISGLEADLARLQDTVATASRAQPGEDPRVADLDKRLADLAATVEAGARPAANPQPSAPDVEPRLQELQTLVQDMAGKLETLSGTDNAGLGQRVEALSEEVRAARASATEAQTMARAETSSEGDRTAIALSAAGALDAALMRGQPFASELATIRALAPGVDAGPLAAEAEAGLPPAGAIAARWRAAFEAAPPPVAADASVVDRLMANARSLVRVTPVGEPEGDAPEARRARFLAALERGDLTRALSEWQGFAPSIQAAAAEPAELARRRIAAEAAATSLRTALLQQARATVTPR